MSVAKGFRLSDDSTASLDWNYVTNSTGSKTIIEEVNDVKTDLNNAESIIGVHRSVVINSTSLVPFKIPSGTTITIYTAKGEALPSNRLKIYDANQQNTDYFGLASTYGTSRTVTYNKAADGEYISLNATYANGIKVVWFEDQTLSQTVKNNTSRLSEAENAISINEINISDAVEELRDNKIRCLFENGDYTVTSGVISENNSQYQLNNFRRTKITKFPAHSQFIITDSNIRGYVYYSIDGENFVSANWISKGMKFVSPESDFYAAFSLTRIEGGTIPTLQECHDGFYIQPPYETKNFIDLIEADSVLRASGKFNPHGRFVVGGLLNGKVTLSNFNRIAFVDYTVFPVLTKATIASGFRAGFQIIENGEMVSDTGWKTGSLNLTAGSQYIFVISRTTEQTETEENWWFDFVKAITFEAAEQPASIPNISLNKPFMFSTRPKFMLHRGLQSEAPENSIPAFTLAGQRNAWAIETDVYETTDGRFVCIHDATVDRTTDGTGTVTDMTYAQIQACTIDIGANIVDYPNLKIPVFEDYLAICKTYGCVAFIEIKGVTNLQALYDTVVAYGMEYQSVFIVWESLLNRVRAVDSDEAVPCLLNGYSTDSTYETILTTAKKYKNVMLGLEIGTLLTDDIIREAHKNDITVGCWTVNNLSDAISYFSRGIDLVTTNSLTSLT